MKLLTLFLMVLSLEGCVVAPAGRYYPQHSYYPVVPHHHHFGHSHGRRW
jgi:hypothetical protein